MNPGWQVVDLTGLEGSVRYRRGQMEIRRIGENSVTIPLANVAVILIGATATISGGLLTKLRDYDIALLVCDWRRVPVAAAYPWSDHTRLGARQRGQVELTLPRRKNAWGRIVSAKILGQANNLYEVSPRAYERLKEIANNVRSGDPDNREAVAARRYWRSFMQDVEFKREPQSGDGVNALFDYAYTVLRGHGIRALCSAGLSGTIGVFHHGRDNPYALVDDLIEPFRPAVDGWLLATVECWDIEDPSVRKTLVRAADETFEKSGATIATRLTRFAQDYGRYVEGDLQLLPVPLWRGVKNAQKRKRIDVVSGDV